jgi:hypothetical protein
MSSPIRYMVIFALSLGWGGVIYTANSQTLPIAQTKTKKIAAGSVSGRITIRGKGKSGIVVGLGTGEFGPQVAPALKATTDGEGNYRINKVTAGSYIVAPIAPSYFIPDSSSFGFRGKNLIVGEGENVEGIDFSLVRGAAITGRVTDSTGRPVVEERIQVTREDQTDQRGPLTASGLGFLTDDRGIYRVFGLPPGRYKISAGQADQFFPAVSRGRVAYSRTFHPDASDPSEAKVVELAEGAEATDIDITLRQTAKGFAATGIVVDGETNQPLANVRFGLRRTIESRDGPVAGTGATSNRLGEFRLENLTPGKYAVFIIPQQNSELRSDAVSFEVIDQDVSGLLLRTLKGASVSGTVILDGNADKTVFAKLAKLRVVAYVQSENAGASYFPHASVIGPDGSFRVGGLQSGVANFSLESHNFQSPPGFTISRLELEGVQSPGLEIKGGEQISGVKLVVVYGSGSVRGTLKIENGPPPTGTRFMVRITKPGGSVDNSMVYRPQGVDARGHFVIEGVVAGSYDLIVDSYVPNSRAHQLTARQSITVTEGSVTEVEFVIDVKNNSAPTP